MCLSFPKIVALSVAFVCVLLPLSHAAPRAVHSRRANRKSRSRVDAIYGASTVHRKGTDQPEHQTTTTDVVPIPHKYSHVLIVVQTPYFFDGVYGRENFTCPVPEENVPVPRPNERPTPDHFQCTISEEKALADKADALW